MKIPGLPAYEKERIAALRSLNLLDSEPEERFDRLTRMAKRLFGVSIALVTMVDSERQWFKSKSGLDICETSRDISFCGHAILGNDVFVVEDAIQDERFCDNPWVADGLGLRFYAGAPLCDLHGNKLGTLCIFDQKPRSLEQEDLKAFRDLAEMAEAELGAIQQVTIDDLTRISNRRGFASLAQNSISLCSRHASPVSMVFFDLDDFEPINDQFGHAEGDRALITFANLMRKSFRESDVFARIGGDEFAVLLTDTKELQANKIVTRFRDKVERYNALANRGYDICFSDGIVQMEPDQKYTVEDLLREADVLMYEKKLDPPVENRFARQA